MSVNSDIYEIAREILFVKDPLAYPEQMWEELGSILEVYLSAEDLSLLGNMSEEEVRQFRVNVLAELITSGVYFQMSDIVAANSSDKTSSKKTASLSDEILLIYTVLNSLGLNYSPGSFGLFNFHSKIGESPVYVWTSRELRINEDMLRTLLDLAGENSYKHLYIVAPPQLTTKLPSSITGLIPFDFLPAIYDEMPKTSEIVNSVE